MRRRSLALALALALAIPTAFAQAVPQSAPAADTARLSTPGPGATITLAQAPENWRVLDGRYVRIAAPLTLVGTDGLERAGQLTVAFGGRLWQPTEVAAPGTPDMARVLADNQRRRLVLDDGSAARDPQTVPYLAAGGVLRTGMSLRNVEGRVHVDGQGRPTLHLGRALELPPLQRPQAPQVPGALKIAAFNLENFFNGDGRGSGFPTLRGARTLGEHQAQLKKLLATIMPLQADVAALMELENDGYGPDSAIATLVAALNGVQGSAGDWRFVEAGNGPGDNPIRVGIIYRSSRVSPLGEPATLQGGTFTEHSRVPLAQAFTPAGGGRPFVVVANHFKSKGCRDASGADADQNDGQSCWNATRVASARQLEAWMQGDPTGTGTPDAVLLGDFNAYAMEDPIRALHGAGWQDAFAVAKVQHPYSYVYNGYTGRLDHALLNAGMAARLQGAAEWHANADEQDASGYQKANVEGPWRSSDHDPLLLGFAR
ncbi:ExeM/NucH family extracellular endonuclease [Xanthomonas sp. 60]